MRLQLACPHCTMVPGRLSWMRLNRALAWGLVLSPLVQIALGTNFWRGLALDLAILLAHGALSLALFGPPRAPASSRWLLWVGIEPEGLSPRNRFLMTGWSIALAVMYTPAIFLVPIATLVVGMPLLLIWLLLPIRLWLHVQQASTYALRRQGLTDPAALSSAAIGVVLFFAGVNLVNLLR